MQGPMDVVSAPCITAAIEEAQGAGYGKWVVLGGHFLGVRH